MPRPIIIVTGASRGIGRAIAKELQARGAVVFLTSNGIDRISRMGSSFAESPVFGIGVPVGRIPSRAWFYDLTANDTR